MNFKNRYDLMNYLKYDVEFIGSGARGECYFDLNNKVIKILYSYIEDKNYAKEEDIFKFNNIKNNTFIFPNDLVTVDNKIVGYISKYVKGIDLYKVNPLNVNLDTFENKIKIAKKNLDEISKKNIRVYDVMYNILLGRKIYVIDTDEYSYSDMELSLLKKRNNYSFDVGLFLFLIDSYFDEFVSENKELKELYESREDIILFLKLFRNKLSEYVEHNIVRLNECKKYLNKNKNFTLVKMGYNRMIQK